MSTEPTADIYQTITQTSDSFTSKNAVDVVIENLGEVISKTEASAAYETRAKGRPMLLHNPQKESRTRMQHKSVIARQKDDKSRRKANHESRTERRLSRTATRGLKYQTFLDIHKLWTGYMSELLNLQSLSSISGSLDTHVASHAIGMQTKLVKADFHGSKLTGKSPLLLQYTKLNEGLTVKASKCPTLVGVSGIVIEETANVFRVITPDDRVKVLPKQNSVFTFSIPLKPEQEDSAPQIQFELYGNQFRFRADDRASRKFKSKETIEL